MSVHLETLYMWIRHFPLIDKEEQFCLPMVPFLKPEKSDLKLPKLNQVPTGDVLFPGFAIAERMKNVSYWEEMLGSLDLTVEAAEGSGAHPFKYTAR